MNVSSRTINPGMSAAGPCLARLVLAGVVASATVALPPRPNIPTGGNGGVIVVPDLENLPPTPPIDVRVSSRRATSLTIRFKDTSNDETGFHIYRADGFSIFQQSPNFQLIATLPPGDGSEQRFVNSGLTPDTPYSYVVGAFNANGERSLQPFGAYTRALADEPVWRLQLAVRVSNSDDADMDDNLEVRLNTSDGRFLPARNSTWLDYGRDDFERGSFFVYDLNLETIEQRSDINQITLLHEGSDAVCIDSIGLFVNGVSVFARDFAAEGGCKLLDNHDSFHVSHERLRADPRWNAYQTPPVPLRFTRAELESRIESMVGDMLHDQPAYWGDRDGRAFVEATFVDPQRLHVTLDLEGEANNMPDPEVDIDFDLVVSAACAPDGSVAVSITTENFHANVSLGILGGVIDFFTGVFVALDEPCEGGISGCIERRIAQAIESQFVPISLQINADLPICEAGLEPTVEVTPDAELILGIRRRDNGARFEIPLGTPILVLDPAGGAADEPVTDDPAADPGESAEDPEPEHRPTPVDPGTVDAPEDSTGSNDAAAGDSAAPGAAPQSAGSSNTAGGAAAERGEPLAPLTTGCGGPMLLNALLAMPAVFSMRRGAHRKRLTR